MLLGYPAEQDFDEWSRMIDVNVKGVLTGTKAVLSDMIARNEGTIINIRSIAGRKTFDNHSVYCGTKYAVHAMTESMRREASGSNVRMIVIAPGVVETPLLSHTSNQEIKDNYNLWKQEIDGGLEPSQIADCAWFAYQMPQEVCVREIVIAKTKQAAAKLSVQVSSRSMEKEYLAVTEGIPQPSEGELCDWLLRNGRTNTSQVVEPGTPQAKDAKLRYQVEQTDEEQQKALVHIWLHTGRHHQIRVQFAHAGYPLMGDTKYGREAVAGRYCPVALCSCRIAFIHPVTGKEMEFTIRPKGNVFTQMA